MAKKRAFVRYSKQGKIVPGSLILTAGSFPNGPSTWKEVPADLCCDSGGCCSDGTVQLVVYPLLLEPLPVGPVCDVQVNFSCVSNGYETNVVLTTLSNTSPTIIETYEDMLNYLNTYFNYLSLTWLLTGPSTLEVIVDKKYLTCDCQNISSVTLSFTACPA